MKFLITCLFSICTFSLYAQSTRVDSILQDFRQHPERVMVAAHRGPHINHPENSLAAIREAIRLGVDIVELDVRETKDGVLVLMHDKTITRTTGQPGGTQDYTYAQLRQFPLLHNGQPTTERIPTLEAALQLVKDHILIDIDFKADGAEAARKTCALLRTTGTTTQALFFLYDYKEATQLRSWDAQVPIMPRAYNPVETAAILQMGKFPAIHIDESFYSAAVAGSIRNAGARVWLNALGKYDKAEQETPGAGFTQLLEKYPAVNIIQTDLPGELIAFLRAKGLHR
ncbi:glycerophosphodiester phosphodiesterase [Chitinophaga alhagiae]|uniref:Glycerophosphodiester phosphodiesterase n=1 Tax=Chitinophaga alhagiae TaxID=2203219 RepID=A0ABM6WDT7_9BACT|nr:glycerophosphodiester phosphodiesterase family protein [Chitinophaga alhagiae]AWO02112.1 glycerophosphodiester phosphodiesterase [Chitinophaga alhagiae]